MPHPGPKPEGLSRPCLTGLAVALIFGVAVYFRLHDLGARNLWTDEAWVALAAMQPTAKAALAAGQSTPPFYLLTVWALVQLWGHSEMVLRSLSWLFGVGTLWLIWRLARVLAEVPAALLALAAVAFSPIMVYYSKELKQYSGDAFFAVLVAVAGGTPPGLPGPARLAGPGPGRGGGPGLLPTPDLYPARRGRGPLGHPAPGRSASVWPAWAGSGSWPPPGITSCLFAGRSTPNWWPIGPRTSRISPACCRFSGGWGRLSTAISGIFWGSGG